MNAYGLSRLFFFASIGCLIAFSGCQGKDSDTLSRGTALTILNQNSDRLLQPYSNSLTIAITASVPIDPPPKSDDPSVQNLAFMNILVDEGVLRREPAMDKESEWGLTQHFKNHAYAFSVRRSDAEVDFGNAFNPPTVKFGISTARFGSVTGVTQQGNTAQVEVEILNTPTEIYKLLAEAQDRTRSKVGNPQFSVSRVLDSGALSRAKTLRIPFRKYDDGWRIAI